MDELKHFSHIHGLVSHHIPPPPAGHPPQYHCSGCKSPASGHLYACWKCTYFLHDQCFRAPRSLNHPSHPLHPLTLYPFPTYPSASFICNSCHLPGDSFSYGCSHCDFDIHVHCALLHPNPNPHYNINIPDPSFNSQPQPQVYPPPPVHANPPVPNYPHQNTVYPPVAPSPPNYNNFPPSNNPPMPTLQTQPPTPIYNNITPPPPPQLNQQNTIPQPPPQPNPPNPTIPIYSTVVNATTTTTDPPVTPPPKPFSTSLIKHFSHPHNLKAMEIDKANAKVCSACECELSGSAYCCTESYCTFNLHKSCFDSPLEVKHKSHLQHPLKLLTAPPYKDGFTCNACLKDGKAFAYTCETCSYDLHIDCIQWPDTVIRPDHKHALTLYYSAPATAAVESGESQDVTFMCDVCKNPVHEMAWVYYCRECDFGTHLECIASGVKVQAESGGGAKSEEELLREMELKFAVLQLLLGGRQTRS